MFSGQQVQRGMAAARVFTQYPIPAHSWSDGGICVILPGSSPASSEAKRCAA